MKLGKLHFLIALILIVLPPFFVHKLRKDRRQQLEEQAVYKTRMRTTRYGAVGSNAEYGPKPSPTNTIEIVKDNQDIKVEKKIVMNLPLLHSVQSPAPTPEIKAEPPAKKNQTKRFFYLNLSDNVAMKIQIADALTEKEVLRLKKLLHNVCFKADPKEAVKDSNSCNHYVFIDGGFAQILAQYSVTNQKPNRSIASSNSQKIYGLSLVCAEGCLNSDTAIDFRITQKSESGERIAASTVEIYSLQNSKKIKSRSSTLYIKKIYATEATNK